MIRAQIGATIWGVIDLPYCYTAERRAVFVWMRRCVASCAFGFALIGIASGSTAEDAAPVARQAEELLEAEKFIEALALVAGSDSPELVYLQFRAELGIGRRVDAEAHFSGSKWAHYISYVKNHGSDFRYSEALQGYRLSEDRNEHFLRRLRNLHAPTELVNLVNLEILNEDFSAAAEGGYVMSARKRDRMEAFGKRYEEFLGVSGIDNNVIEERISLITREINRFDQQQALQVKE